MTKKDWLKVKRGDVVIGPNGIRRPVVSVSRWKTNRNTYRTCIELTKLRKSWTSSPTTLYWNHDDRGWRLKR